MKKSSVQFLILLIITFSMQLANAQDWANLKKYQKDNEKYTYPLKGEQRVVFMGNSITEGWLNQRSDFFKNKNYINRGISGQTTPQMLIRFKQDVVDLKPAVVVLLAGINDIAGNTGPSSVKMITDNISSMIEIAKMNHIDVLLCSVLPANRFSWQPDKKPAEEVIKLNKELKKLAKTYKVKFVDYYSQMVDEQKGLKKELGDDGVHPNEKGYAIMEKVIEKAIHKQLKK